MREVRENRDSKVGWRKTKSASRRTPLIGVRHCAAGLYLGSEQFPSLLARQVLFLLDATELGASQSLC